MPSQYHGFSRQSAAQTGAIPAGDDVSIMTTPTLRSIMQSQVQATPPGAAASQASTNASSPVQAAQIAQGTTLYDCHGNPVGRFMGAVVTCCIGSNATQPTHTNALVDSGANTGLLGAAFRQE